MKPNRLPLGEVLKLARKRRGLTGRAMARLTGKPSSYIHKLETGLLSPTVDTLTELCPFYEIEPFEAVAGFLKEDLIHHLLGPVPFDDPDVREILRLASKPDGVEEIRAMLEVAKDGPAKFRETMAVLKEMRRIGLIGGGK